MRHNGRPAIIASQIAPNLLAITEQGRALIGCPDCGCWKSIKRGMITAHRGPEEPGAEAWPAEFRPPRKRCPGSGQRVRVDLSYEDWREQLAQASAHARQRRATKVVRRPKPPMAKPVHRMATARA